MGRICIRVGYIYVCGTLGICHRLARKHNWQRKTASGSFTLLHGAAQQSQHFRVAPFWEQR